MYPTMNIGRIVHYIPVSDVEAKHNGAERLPAIVVRSWGDQYINLMVFTDGEDVLWRTSVSRGDTLSEDNKKICQGYWEWPHVEGR